MHSIISVKIVSMCPLSIANGGHIGLFFNKNRLMQVRFNPRYYVARSVDNIDRLYNNWLYDDPNLMAEIANPNRRQLQNDGQNPIGLAADGAVENVQHLNELNVVHESD